MSRFLMQPAFRQFRKNWKNLSNFKGAVVHRSARVGLADFEKIEEKKGSCFRSCHH